MEERVRQMTNVPEMDEDEAVGAEVGNGLGDHEVGAVKSRPAHRARPPNRSFGRNPSQVLSPVGRYNR